MIFNMTSAAGKGAAQSKAVNFYDDLAGGIVKSYTAEEFAALNSLPANPNHSDFTFEGFSIPMTSQGWNWSLSDAKTYVAANGALNIGQIYIPTDGKTHVVINIPDDDIAFDAQVRFEQSVANGVTVDWGDGSTPETYSDTGAANHSHTYSTSGKKHITLAASSGTTVTVSGTASSSMGSRFNGEASKTRNWSRILGVFFGEIEMGDYPFSYNVALKTVTIPNSVTGIGKYAFYGCAALKSITIPSGVTEIDQYSFSVCDSMESAALPNGVETIGNYAFRSNRSLRSITLPNSVDTIGSAVFAYCAALKSAALSSGLDSIGSTMFGECSSLQNVMIPGGITEIGGSSFINCYALQHIALPNSVTGIGSSAFSGCSSLQSITIPSGVTEIGNNAFEYCTVLTRYHFLPTTPPVLGGSDVFKNIQSDAVIYVPSASLNTYKTATNYTGQADKMQGE